MVPTRRDTLRVAGAAGIAGLAGCSRLVSSQEPASTYSLDVDRIRQPLIEYALDEPRGDGLFAETEQEAYDAILPTGRCSTYGYTPIAEDQYLRHDGRFYQTKVVVTGEERMERTLVRVTPLEENVPDDATLIEWLPQASSRVFKILHSNAVSNGESGAADLLHGDAYVLRRPPEVNGPIPAELDGAVVKMDPEGNWAYRVHTTTAELYEPEYTALAVQVAASEAEFDRVVFGAVVDQRLAAADLTEDEQELLEQAIERDVYRETTPLSDAYRGVLGALGLDDVTTASNGHVLWYADAPHRYGLYVNEAE